jgi:hypothetical protein
MSRWSFIAQRATTGEFIDWDVPIRLDSLEWELNGPGALTGTIAPDAGGLRGSDGRPLLEEWGTLLYAEADGEIRWGGIVVSCSFEGESWRLECAGFATYPHSVIYDGDYSQIGVDPADVIRHIWAHVQSFPDGNLDVAVVGDSTPVRLGRDAWDETVANEDGSTDVKHHEAEPYVLLWTDSTNCGAEIDDLAKSAPLDWAEKHRWSPDGESVVHEIQLAYPRLGRRRDDLVFVQGDNVTNVLTVESNGDDFANTVLGLGAGEGRAMLRRSTSLRDGRLRRVATYSDKAITDSGRLDAHIAAELNARRAALRITSLDVIDHDNARLGAWQVGDDVLVRAEVPWLGEIEMWVRITAWALTGDHTATLTVSRSDLFRYGG